MERELTLYDYLSLIRKHKYTIVLCVIIMLAATYMFTLYQVPVYKATATVKIDLSNIFSTVVDPMGTEVKMIAREDVVKEALTKLNLKDDYSDVQNQLTAAQIGFSNMIQITAKSNNPKKVRDIVNTIVEVYVQKSNDDKNKSEQKQKEYVESQLAKQEKELFKAEENLKNFKSKGGISGLASTYASKLIELNAQLTNLLNNYTEEHPEVQKKKREIKFTEDQIKSLSEQDMDLIRLLREVNINDSLYSNLRRKAQEAEILEAGKRQFAIIAERALEPKYPIGPNMRLNMIVGAILGLIIGSFLSFLLESLDITIMNVEELETFIGLPVLGLIPHAPIDEKRKSSFFKISFKKTNKIDSLRNHLILWTSPKSSLTESYHTLRTNISFNILKNNKKTVIFTSSGPSEGKTVCIVNYALSHAETGKKVVLVESDLRRPMIHKIFGVDKANGLSDILLGSITWKQALKGTPDFLMSGLKLDSIIGLPSIENLKIITCGRYYSNPTEIMNSSNMEKLIHDLRENFDLILFDCPPILLFADATILASKVDATVFVYRAGRTSRIALKRAKSQLDNIKASILGIVLNDVRVEMMPQYGGYYYSSKYYREDKKQS